MSIELNNLNSINVMNYSITSTEPEKKFTRLGSHRMYNRSYGSVTDEQRFRLVYNVVIKGRGVNEVCKELEIKY